MDRGSLQPKTEHVNKFRIAKIKKLQMTSVITQIREKGSARGQIISKCFYFESQLQHIGMKADIKVLQRRENNQDDKGRDYENKEKKQRLKCKVHCADLIIWRQS